MKNRNIFYRIWRFYADGFRQMTVGRYLWVMIILKVAILFLVFKLFFFPDRLREDYDSDPERARAVRRELMGRDERAPQPVDDVEPVTENSSNQNLFKVL